MLVLGLLLNLFGDKSSACVPACEIHPEGDAGEGDDDQSKIIHTFAGEYDHRGCRFPEPRLNQPDKSIVTVPIIVSVAETCLEMVADPIIPREEPK